MESTSEPMKIHISQTTHELLGSDYSTTDRGEIAVKGKGTIAVLNPSFFFIVYFVMELEKTQTG